MTLENLLAIGQLKEHPADKAEIQQLLDAAQRNLADAGYKVIMQVSLVVLMAHGYRPDTRGHHQLLIQTLPKSMGLSSERMVVFDALRRKRNNSDYSGTPIDEKAMQACIDEARILFAEVKTWLRNNIPEFA